MSDNPYSSPSSNLTNTNHQTDFSTFGMKIFLAFWFTIYALLLTWGYFSNIHWREEFPTLANSELHPLRVAFNETISMLPILIMEPCFGYWLGKYVAIKSRRFWAHLFTLALLAGFIQGVWVLLVDLGRRLVTGLPTGNEPSYAIMAISFFVLTFIVTALVHCLLGAFLRLRWRRLPSPSFKPDAASTS